MASKRPQNFTKQHGGQEVVIVRRGYVYYRGQAYPDLAWLKAIAEDAAYGDIESGGVAKHYEKVYKIGEAFSPGEIGHKGRQGRTRRGR